MIRLLAHRAVDAAGMGVEIGRGLEERGEKWSNTFTALLSFIFILQLHQQFSMSKELRHDRHTVSLLTDHMVFSPKYRGKVLVGDVAMLAEAIIRKTCKELDIKIIDM
jgi:Transposase IS200 like